MLQSQQTAVKQQQNIMLDNVIMSPKKIACKFLKVSKSGPRCLDLNPDKQ